ncbi:MAG: AbrB/MazE/SpoVT family DNA-binding domain-containing protein, partial [Oscillospiraceae bacterium]|nr:AbrB/MazE/SpoVT family DNA-binding domain-containing protein [Oscillospiraceae bacterium]
MKTSRKLSQNGGITIPKDMRLKLGWKRGMSLDISTTP